MKTKQNSKILDLNWPQKLESFMINKGEQGKTPITSANEFLRLLGPTPSEAAG